MKAIVTKYIGPTNHHSARIRVKAEGVPPMTVLWDDALYIDANHTAAAKQFAERYSWHGQWFGGGMPDQTGNCYVKVPGVDDSKGAMYRQLYSEVSFYISKDESK